MSIFILQCSTRVTQYKLFIKETGIFFFNVFWTKSSEVGPNRHIFSKVIWVSNVENSARWMRILNPNETEN